MPDILKLQCTCPVCASSGGHGGQLEIYGADFSKTALQLDRPELFHKWLINGRWSAERLVELADLVAKERDWFQCASCDFYFPVPLAQVHGIKLLALQYGDPEWRKALEVVNLLVGPGSK